MSAPIPSSGAPASKSEQLFSGIKFWVAHRVPIRSNLLKMVEENGGEVVALEKQATMLIADHARRDVPPGSYSWQFIEFSVSRGRLEDAETHLIVPAGISRPVGASQPAKRSRTIFTAEDDDVLTKWVMKCERKGGSAAGNKIYKDLEKKYPRHTWQSWRDRWVRKLDKEPHRRQLYDQAIIQGNGDGHIPPLSSHHPSSSRSLPQARSPTSARHREPLPAKRYQRPAGLPRAKFTEDDDKLLRRFCEEAAADGKSLGGNAIYIGFAADHPRHTWQSWRDRWVRYLSQRGDEVSDRDEVQAVQRPSATAAARTPTAGNGGRSVSSATRARPNGHASSTPNRNTSTTGNRAALANESGRTNAARPSHSEQHANDGAAAGRTEEEEVLGSVLPTQAHLRSSFVRTVLRGDDEEGEEEVTAKASNSNSGAANRLSSASIKEEDVERRSSLSKVPQKGSTQLGTAAEVKVQAVVTHSEGRGIATSANLSLQPQTADQDVPLRTAESPSRAARQETTREESLPGEESDEDSSVPPAPAPRTIRDQFFMDLDDFMDMTKVKIDARPRIGGRSVDIWDLYQAVTSQKVLPETRDWEAVATALGYDWIDQPEVTKQLKETYEQSLGEFEASLRAFAELDDQGGNEDEDGLEPGLPPHQPTEQVVQESVEEVVPEGRLSGLKRTFQRAIGMEPAPTKTPTRTRVHQSVEASSPSDRTNGRGATKRRRIDSGSKHAATESAGLPRTDTQTSMDVTPSQQLHSEMESVTPIPYPGNRARSAAAHALVLSDGNQPARASSYTTADEVAPVEPLSDETEIQGTSKPAGKLLSKEDVDYFEAFGYSREVVLEGLKATTMTSRDAGFVMQKITDGSGVPENHAGIWTDRDDEDLAFVDKVRAEQEDGENVPRDRVKRSQTAMKRLQRKHGEPRIALRKEFLSSWNAFHIPAQSSEDSS